MADTDQSAQCKLRDSAFRNQTALSSQLQGPMMRSALQGRTPSSHTLCVHVHTGCNGVAAHNSRDGALCCLTRGCLHCQGYSLSPSMSELRTQLAVVSDTVVQADSFASWKSSCTRLTARPLRLKSGSRGRALLDARCLVALLSGSLPALRRLRPVVKRPGS